MESLKEYLREFLDWPITYITLISVGLLVALMANYISDMALLSSSRTPLSFFFFFSLFLLMGLLSIKGYLDATIAFKSRNENALSRIYYHTTARKRALRVSSNFIFFVTGYLSVKTRIHPFLSMHKIICISSDLAHSKPLEGLILPLLLLFLTSLLLEVPALPPNRLFIRYYIDSSTYRKELRTGLLL